MWPLGWGLRPTQTGVNWDYNLLDCGFIWYNQAGGLKKLAGHHGYTLY